MFGKLWQERTIPPLLILVAAVLMDMLGFGIVIPLLPFYAEEMGATPFVVTLLFASFSATQLLAAPFWGRLSDRHGRKPLIVIGLFASSFSHMLYGLAGTLFLLFASRMAAGAAGGTISVAQAYVADTTDDEERAKGLGWIGAAAGLGIMLGPPIGGFFSRWGLGMPGFIAAGLAGLNAVVALLFLGESRPQATRDAARAGEAGTLRGWIRALTRYPMSILLPVYFLSISSFAALTAVLALYLERTFQFTGEDVGYVLALMGGVTVLVRGVLLGPIVNRFGEPRTARLGAVALGVGLLGIPLMPNGWWLVLLAPMIAIGTGTLFPSLASLVSRATDRDSQGSVLGGYQVVGGIGRVTGPIWAGLLFQHLTIRSPFQLGAGLVAIAALLSSWIPEAKRGRRAVGSQTEESPSAEQQSQKSSG